MQHICLGGESAAAAAAARRTKFAVDRISPAELEPEQQQEQEPSIAEQSKGEARKPDGFCKGWEIFFPPHN